MMFSSSDLVAKNIAGLIRTILRNICDIQYSGIKVYVWSKTRIASNKIVSITDVIDGFKDVGAVPIERIENLLKYFPTVIIANVVFICKYIAEAVLIMYFPNDYGSLGIKLSLVKVNHSWRIVNSDVILIS